MEGGFGEGFPGDCPGAEGFPGSLVDWEDVGHCFGGDQGGQGWWDEFWVGLWWCLCLGGMLRGRGGGMWNGVFFFCTLLWLLPVIVSRDWVLES